MHVYPMPVRVIRSEHPHESVIAFSEQIFDYPVSSYETLSIVLDAFFLNLLDVKATVIPQF